MRLFITFLSLFLVHQGYSQKKPFEKGKILDSIHVSNTQETYALYLPKGYDPEKPSSVVLIFDPGGRGQLGISTFVEASETYNHILVCSNNTKNGVPYETNFEITNRLTETVFNTFKIDDNQVYTAGFSGGSRLASAIAALTNKIQGVVACGAGLSVNKSFTPSKDMFSFVGLVGDEDMNYLEMLNTRKWLNNYKIENALFVYKDNHRWPPKAQILRAFGWLEIQAYKRGLKAVNNEIIHNLYKQHTNIADSLKISGLLSRSVMEYENILSTYKPFFDLDSIDIKMQTIKSSKAYNATLKEKKRIADLENDTFRKFSKVFSEEIKLAKSKDNFYWWREEVKLLDKLINDNKNSQEVKMYKRLRYSLYASAIESSDAYINKREYKQALYCDKLLTIYNNDKPYWYYRLAQSYARNDDYKSTIRQLKKAIKLGFNYKNYIENTVEFKNYKNRKEFKKILASI